MGKHLPAIDGLRAVAVLSVVAYHAGFPAGFVGVDVFFVISGYVITRLLMEGGDLLNFYARRARRILPAAFLVVLVTLGLSFLLMPSAGDVARSAAAAGVFVANLHFQMVTGGYWSADALTMPLLHLWSLSVEEQFYLLWPLLLIFARKRPSVLWWVFWASLALYLWLSYANPNAAFYQTPARAWELTAGALVSRQALVLRGGFTGFAGLALVLLACLVPMPVPVATGLAVLGATLVCCEIHSGSSVRILEARPLVWVGLISYSLYLWHWPLLAIDRAVRVGEPPLSVRIALVGVAFVLAALSYRYVEQPFRRMQVPPGRAVGAGIAGALALSVGAWSVPAIPPEARAANDSPPRECHSLNTDAPRMKCEASAKVLVWGDSMAYAWMPAFAGADQATRDACPPMVGYLPALPTKREMRCREFNDFVASRAEMADTVVLVAWWIHQPDLKALAPTLERLKGVRRVVLIGPTPVMRAKVPDCIRLAADCSVTRESFDAQAEPILAQLRALSAKYANVQVVDVTDRFCNAGTCPPVSNGVPLYWDTHHVSVKASSSSQSFFRR